MARSDLGLLATVPLFVYAAVQGFDAIGPVDGAVVLGFLAALAPALGLWRRDLELLGWLPGTFLLVVTLTVAGISPNALPGALGELAGGFVIGSPFFAGLIAAASGDHVGRRAFALIVALLAAAAVVSIAASGAAGDASGLATLFAQVPKLQALAVASVLTGMGIANAPFVSSTTPLFAGLALLAGAGGLASLVSVDRSRDPEALGFDTPGAPVPEGTYRSLLPDGRLRLTEATAPERPSGADPSSLGSVVVAAGAALATLVVATEAPDHLIAVTVGIAVVLLAAVLLTVWTRRPRTTPAVPSPAASQRS
jgi:hypothetical protein